MLLYLKMHGESMRSDDIKLLFGWGEYEQLTKDGFPMSLDAREYDEWMDCVGSVLASNAP